MVVVVLAAVLVAWVVVDVHADVAILEAAAGARI